MNTSSELDASILASQLGILIAKMDIVTPHTFTVLVLSFASDVSLNELDMANRNFK